MLNDALYLALAAKGGGGGGSSDPHDFNDLVKEKDVNFMDYDGSYVYSYTRAEFLALTEMPALPTHEGLTAQEWNWSFEDAREYVTNNGLLQIGAIYTTADGKTRIYVTVEKNETVTIPISNNPVADPACTTIDWGDGTEEWESTKTHTTGDSYEDASHTYTTQGDYVIKITVKEGYSLSFAGSTNTEMRLPCARKIFIGDRVRSVGIAYAPFLEIYSCSNSVVIKGSITSFSLKCEIMPPALTASSNVGVGLRTTTTSTVYLGTAKRISMSNTSASITYRFCLATRITPKDKSGASGSFDNLMFLKEIIVPSQATTVSNEKCHGWLEKLYVRPTTVPTLSSNSFQYTDPSMKIIVPKGKLQDYQDGTNWSAYASQMIEEDW